MPQWSEDLSECSLEEVLRSQAENRAWSKELRRKNNDLVNSRLAKNISQEDYAADRKLVQGEAVECQRRANIIDTHIVRRSVRALPRES